MRPVPGRTGRQPRNRVNARGGQAGRRLGWVRPVGAAAGHGGNSAAFVGNPGERIATTSRRHDRGPLTGISGAQERRQRCRAVGVPCPETHRVPAGANAVRFPGMPVAFWPKPSGSPCVRTSAAGPPRPGLRAADPCGPNLLRPKRSSPRSCDRCATFPGGRAARASPPPPFPPNHRELLPSGSPRQRASCFSTDTLAGIAGLSTPLPRQCF